MYCLEKDIFPSTVLHWNYRGFTEFPLKKLCGDECEITDIYLKENLIATIPSDIGRLERLESLYLSGNDIQELPAEIGKLVHLKCLDLSGNRLCRLPDEIGDVKNLKYLILDDNYLTELPLRLAELRTLRYLSVCDNRLRWLPQRPVYNYHHCELRFWRNGDLKSIPYSLWYHMFRDQQTRSLNIGCLGVTKNQSSSKHRCQLKIQAGAVDWKIEIDIPYYSNVIPRGTKSPANLLELCKRKLYEIVYETAKALSNSYFSVYGDNRNHNDSKSEDENGNIFDNLRRRVDKTYNNTCTRENVDNEINLEENFNEVLTILESEAENVNVRNGITVKVVPSINKRLIEENNCLCSVETKKTHYAPTDIVQKYFDYLPKYIKKDLCIGPISRCENVQCKKPVFDYATFEFCVGKILLIDNSEDAVLSAVFCSKSCADAWKVGKTNIISWELISS